MKVIRRIVASGDNIFDNVEMATGVSATDLRYRGANVQVKATSRLGTGSTVGYGFHLYRGKK
jgi:hypothetical protein